MSRIVVVGGGIGGLSVAHALCQRDAERAGHELVVLERASRPGGNIRTERLDGYLCEWGPNGFLDNAPATLALARDLGLDGALHPADPRASKRFVYRHGRL